MTNKLTTQDQDFSKALSNTNAYNQAMVVAKNLAKSNFIPQTFKGNEADCLIALIMSEQLKTNPVTLMQEMYIVHGKPAFSAKFITSLANKLGPFTAPIAYEVKGKGDDLEVTAYAPMKDGPRAEATVSMKMAKAEGWASKNKKYQTMPEHMLKFRAATFLARTYCPDVLMGFTSKEEVKDVYVAPIEEKKALLVESLEAEPIVKAPADRVHKMFQKFNDLGISETEILDELNLGVKEELTLDNLDELTRVYNKMLEDQAKEK